MIITKKPAPKPEPQPDNAMKAAMDICHDLHEGHVPGTKGKDLFPLVNLYCQDMQAAREHLAAIIRHHCNP